jgi:hypothetical protein
MPVTNSLTLNEDHRPSMRRKRNTELRYPKVSKEA